MKRTIKNKKEGEKSISPAKLASIKRGLKDIEEGRVHPHSEIRKMYGKRLLRSSQ